MNLEYVNEIAQGRVWSGEMAKKIGLVDVLGGLEDAVNIASNMIDSKDYTIISYPKQKNSIEQLTNLIEIKSNNINYLNLNYETIFYDLKNKDKIQTRMPYNIFIN